MTRISLTSKPTRSCSKCHAPINGVLKEIRIENGATVTSGELLAMLEPGEAVEAAPVAAAVEAVVECRRSRCPRRTSREYRGRCERRETESGGSAPDRRARRRCRTDSRHRQGRADSQVGCHAVRRTAIASGGGAGRSDVGDAGTADRGRGHWSAVSIACR